MGRPFWLCALLLLACSRGCSCESDEALLLRGELALCHASHSGLLRTHTGSGLEGARAVRRQAGYKFGALVIVDVRLCSGAVVSSTHVITSSYCTEQFDIEGGLVFAGGHKYMTPVDLRDDGVQIRAIEEVHLYEPGTDSWLDHDIAVVSVKDGFSFNEHVQPASLTKISSVKWPIHCTMMGFGETFEGDLAHVLSSVNVTLTGPEHCCSEVYTYELGANAACALEVDNAMCWGDMGGPVVDEHGQLVALVAYKTPSKPSLLQCGQPVDNAFFMFLGYYLDWIMSVIHQ